MPIHQQIQHIFVLALENRSFDHVFGSLALKRTQPEWMQQQDGVDAVTGQPTCLDLPDLQFVSRVTPPDGSTPSTMSPMSPASIVDFDPPHEYRHAFLMQNATAPGDWLNVLRNSPLPPMSPDVVAPAIRNHPKLWQAASYLDMDTSTSSFRRLAEEFAVCDRWFSGLPGPTFPNRCFLHAASANGLYDSPTGLELFENLTIDGIQFKNGTVFTSLEAKPNPIDWRIYFGSRFPQAYFLKHMTIWEWAEKYFNFSSDFASHLQQKSIQPGYIFIEPDYGALIGSQMFAGGTCQHPPTSFSSGENLIASTYELIRNSAYWNTSVLIVTYDENGGFYDHARPDGLVTPPGDGSDYADGCAKLPENQGFPGCAFDRLGYRVPTLVISPFIKRNTIDHRQYEHASIPATILSQFGRQPLTERDAHAASIWQLLSADLQRVDGTPTEAPRSIRPVNPSVVPDAPAITAISDSERTHALPAIKFKRDLQVQQDLNDLENMTTPDQLADFGKNIPAVLPPKLIS